MALRHLSAIRPGRLSAYVDMEVPVVALHGTNVFLRLRLLLGSRRALTRFLAALALLLVARLFDAVDRVDVAVDRPDPLDEVVHPPSRPYETGIAPAPSVGMPFSSSTLRSFSTCSS